MVILSTKGFIMNSWAIREISPDPGGLPARYILKTMIPKEPVNHVDSLREDLDKLRSEVTEGFSLAFRKINEL